METSLLNQWFSDREINAACWTLIHSLWIGMIIALFAALVITLTRKSVANLRYRLLCGVLLLFVLSASITFYLEMRSPVVTPAITGATISNISPAYIIPTAQAAVVLHISPINELVSFLNQHTNIIFLVWLLLFVMKSLKMTGGLLYIQRIRTYKVHEVTEEFKHKIKLFSRQIGIGRTVRLVQSELVKVPVAVGWLKPMILLPMGILLQLSPEQLDGILWHELAHIRRRDYLVNILQGLVETIFFFNPGLLWLSSLIRAEREACCDDMVLSRMNRKANYLEALLSFGYADYKQAGLAMSLGSGNQLRDRLKRMINQENKRLSIAEKSVLTIGLVLLTAFTTISKDNPVVKQLTVKFRNKTGKVAVKTFPVSMGRLPEGQRINDSKPATQEKHTIIVTDTAIRFTSVLFKANNADLANSDMTAKDDKDNKYHFIVAGDKLTAMEMNGVKIAEDKLPGYEYMIRYIKREVAEKRRVRASDLLAFKANSPNAKYKSDDLVLTQRILDSLKAARTDDRYVKPRSTDMVTPVMMKREAMRKRAADDNTRYTVQLQRVNNVIADLVKEKVVGKASDVIWFGLSETEFIVNGQKQSDEMQQRYKTKYGIRENYGLYYGPVKMTGTGVFIDAIVANADRRGGVVRPGTKYKGQTGTDSQDSALREVQQLIKQQQLFAAKEDEKRQTLMIQQQLFAAEQSKNRQQLMKQQQRFADEQNAKRQEIMEKQRQLLVRQNEQP
ncbi:MAG TPA: M56 family metallopeptidase [Mucilaginibacter sp.]|jgi:beta-lactamase regulating signal transducer with metallopeptidase domain